jgi:hypothetical protein
MREEEFQQRVATGDYDEVASIQCGPVPFYGLEGNRKIVIKRHSGGHALVTIATPDGKAQFALKPSDIFGLAKVFARWNDLPVAMCSCKREDEAA